MNAALLSSKKMDYCTPQGFFDRLNAEFHFALDAAATDKSATATETNTKRKEITRQRRATIKANNVGAAHADLSVMRRVS